MPDIAQMLQEKCQAATSAVVHGAHAVGEELEHGAQVVAPAAQQGRLALAHGAQLVVDGVQQGAQAVGPAAQQGGQALAHGAQVVGRGVQRGAEIVKAHPKEAAIIAGAAVVAAGALPFVPWSVPAALGVVSAATRGAKATGDALRDCESVERPDEEQQSG